MKKIIPLLLASSSLLITGCHGLKKVSKQEFVERLTTCYTKTPVYRSISGTVKIDGERWTSLLFTYESPDKTDSEQVLADYYDYVLRTQFGYIEDADFHYANNGFKIMRGLDFITWDVYGNLSAINIQDPIAITSELSLNIYITNHY